MLHILEGALLSVKMASQDGWWSATVQARKRASKALLRPPWIGSMWLPLTRLAKTFGLPVHDSSYAIELWFYASNAHTPRQAVLGWGLQRGCSVVPKSRRALRPSPSSPACSHPASLYDPTPFSVKCDTLCILY